MSFSLSFGSTVIHTLTLFIYITWDSRPLPPLSKCILHIVTCRTPLPLSSYPLCLRGKHILLISLTQMLLIGCLLSVCIMYLITIKGNWRKSDLNVLSYFHFRKMAFIINCPRRLGIWAVCSTILAPTLARQLLTYLWSYEVTASVSTSFPSSVTWLLLHLPYICSMYFSCFPPRMWVPPRVYSHLIYLESPNI